MPAAKRAGSSALEALVAGMLRRGAAQLPVIQANGRDAQKLRSLGVAMVAQSAVLSQMAALPKRGETASRSLSPLLTRDLALYRRVVSIEQQLGVAHCYDQFIVGGSA